MLTQCHAAPQITDPSHGSERLVLRKLRVFHLILVPRLESPDTQNTGRRHTEQGLASRSGRQPCPAAPGGPSTARRGMAAAAPRRSAQRAATGCPVSSQ